MGDSGGTGAPSEAGEGQERAWSGCEAWGSRTAAAQGCSGGVPGALTVPSGTVKVSTGFSVEELEGKKAGLSSS